LFHEQGTRDSRFAAFESGQSPEPGMRAEAGIPCLTLISSMSGGGTR
jgi:hypothetical protein